MAKAKRGLGKGLGAFFGEEVVQEVAKDQENEKKEITSDKEEKASVEEKETENENGEFFVKISRIEPNRTAEKGFCRRTASGIGRFHPSIWCAATLTGTEKGRFI